jgi:hypothetical protein
MVAGCTPICALLVRTIDADSASWSALNVRNAAHPNDRPPLLAGAGTAQGCALESG